MDLSIIIVNYNTKKLILDCLKSIKTHTKRIKYEVIVVDNASTDGSAGELSKLSEAIKLIKSKKNLGFAAGNNLGLKKAKGRYVLFLNSDTLINESVLSEMIAWMDRNVRVGVMSCALQYMNGNVQATGGYFPTLLRVFSWMTIQDFPFVDRLIKPFHPMKEKSLVSSENFYKVKRELDWVTGAFMLIRREVIREVGGMPKDYFMYMEEVDWCYRTKLAGWKVMYMPRWSITHIGGASGTKELSVLEEFRGVKKFYEKYMPKWQMVFLRGFLKLGALGRIVLFGILEGGASAKIYAKAYKQV